MRRHLLRSRDRLLSPLTWRVRVVFWAGAMVVGGVIAGFAELAELANGLYAGLARSAPWAAALLPPVGLAAIAWLTRRLAPGAEGSGIPQAIAALALSRRERLLSLRIAVAKVVLTCLALACGASVGREGPSVHVGAAILHSLGRLGRFPPHFMEKGLILAGGAAGISAAFNTPLAGVLFAIEEMSRSFESRSSGIVLTAVILAGIAAIGILGPYRYFGQSPAVMLAGQGWLAVPLCGVIGGVLGGLFSTLLIQLSQRLAWVMAARPVALAFGAGVVVAVAGWLSGFQVTGTGYEQAKAIVMGYGDPTPWFGSLKFVATLASYLSGVPGGIFAPSLATGAGVGADLARWLPVAPPEAMILLGMLAYFVGVVQTPLTGFVIVLEMAANEEMALPMMGTALIAWGASRVVCPRPIYRVLAGTFVEQAQVDRGDARG